MKIKKIYEDELEAILKMLDEQGKIHYMETEKKIYM